jgi:oxygen-independent coproporphyrinogen-3 oxidase
MASESSVLHAGSGRFGAGLTGQDVRDGPCYTSYPTAGRFAAFSYGDYLQTVAAVRVRGGVRSRSLHLHMPCCASACCDSNWSGRSVIAGGKAGLAVYLEYLEHEIEIRGKLFAGMNGLDGLQLCGATADELSDQQINGLMARARRWFKFASDELGEYAIRIDPGVTSRERIDSLRAQGFNQLTLATRLNDTVGAPAPSDAMAQAVAAARDAAFRSVCIELLVGAPQQSFFTLRRALAKVIAAAPERIQVFNAAHLAHGSGSPAEAADDKTTVALLCLCHQRLTEAGYVCLGLNCYVQPTDALAVAQRQGRLHLHLQGYSTNPDADVIACGLAAIGAVGASYSQNQATLDDYYAPLDIGELPIARGLRLSMDDALRRLIIQKLMCNFELPITAIELGYPITFATYFADELERLREMEAEGWLSSEPDWLVVTAKGRLRVRNICMVFDRGLVTAPAETGGSA